MSATTRIAMILNGMVENTIEGTLELCAANGPAGYTYVVLNGWSVDAGDTWDGTRITSQFAQYTPTPDRVLVK